VPADEAEAPKGEAIADPVLREARGQADTILRGLLAGKRVDDSMMARLADKLKGFQDASIRSQKIVRENAAEFQGVLAGPRARARFTMTLVKQMDGAWAVASFSGPNPE
jgi:hypothetical protein